MVREGDEVGDYTQQAVREELLVCGKPGHNLLRGDGDVHEDLGRRRGQELGTASPRLLAMHLLPFLRHGAQHHQPEGL